MNFHLVQRRAVLFPTLLGWICLVAAVGAPLLFWCFQGESFLAPTQRHSAEVLVVESWIGQDGLQAAKLEFENGGYRYLVTSGGMSENRWEQQHWNLAIVSRELLLRAGMPPDRVIAAPSSGAQNNRTFGTALAVRRALEQRGLQPAALNVLTLGVHARRSRLVFAKVFKPNAVVGVIPWTPPDYPAGPWWKSSERADTLMKETIGYFFELLFNSGRMSNSPVEPATPVP